MSNTGQAQYRGWTRPGPAPPGGVDVEEGETLDFLCGHWKIFQYEKGHRYSSDDVLCAWYATTWAPRVDRACDLGSGIGSVALSVAWRLPGARMVTLEAQDISLRLAKKSVRYNGVDDRFTLFHGDLRHDLDQLKSLGPFDLVTGSPPYWPVGTALPAAHPQAIPARLEVRGDINDYARAAHALLADGGVFCCVFQASQHERVMKALDDAELRVVRTRLVRFREDSDNGARVYLSWKKSDLPSTMELIDEPPLSIRRADGSTDPEYAAIRLSFGFPPGNVPAAP
jgi:tRNA1Val (adenine37-N6)-methyltransferase